MDLSAQNNNIETWFLSLKEGADGEFPDDVKYITYYKAIVAALRPVQKQVNAGADRTDGTTLTWHDESHIKKVIRQVSDLLSYPNAEITGFEAFHLLIAIQIHDVKNIVGRDGHETTAVEILNDLQINGLVDQRLLREIGFIASCHAGTIDTEVGLTKDKIGRLPPFLYTGRRLVRAQFLSALLRLADEFADEPARAMAYLTSIGNVAQESIIHQKHAMSLQNVAIEANSPKVEFEYHLLREDAIQPFPKYNKKTNEWEEVYLLDEIFSRVVKSYNETIYCMRFLRPQLHITTIVLKISVEKLSLTERVPQFNCEIVEMGYPNEMVDIYQLTGECLRKNGGFWTGEVLKNHLNAQTTES